MDLRYSAANRRVVRRRGSPLPRHPCYLEINVPYARRNPAAAGSSGAHPVRRIAQRRKIKGFGEKPASALVVVVGPRPRRHGPLFGRLPPEITTGIPVS